MAEIPNLAGTATQDLVEQISGSGSFKASYINWARTVQMLREHAPGWMPEMVRNAEGGMLHRAPVGAYLLIRFRHLDGTITPEVPQAIMDNRNNSIALENITARDVSDTQRRGVCMAAAFTFGLAYELWAKMPLETGYAEEKKPEQLGMPDRISPMGNPWEGMDPEEVAFLTMQAETIEAEFAENGAESAAAMYYRDMNLTTEEMLAVWSLLSSKCRNQSKKFKDQFIIRSEAA